ILARRVIDATGDADVAHRAGARTRTTPKEEMMAVSVMFHLAGVDPRAFRAGVRADPQRYGDWSGGGEWVIETDGKEDELFSPFIQKPFRQAIDDGVIPANLTTLAGTWGAVHDTGELTYMNVVHLDGVDGTDPDDLTRGEIEGRSQAMHAVEALRRYTPGCERARLRNFGMTIGVRDTRKIVARYDLTEDDVRGEARFDDSIGIYPEFIDGYGVLVLPTTGRYFALPYRNLVPQGVGNLLVAGRSTGGDRLAHAATRNMSCCAVLGQGAGIAAAISLHRGTSIDAAPIADIHAELERQGVRYR
ncbi:MAG: FAD-dependent oxidoreductase, partial [Acidimicrobiales bacterium]